MKNEIYNKVGIDILLRNWQLEEKAVVIEDGKVTDVVYEGYRVRGKKNRLEGATSSLKRNFNA